MKRTMTRKPIEQTPISDGRNLGPITEAELGSIGLNSIEQIQALGWEEVCIRYCEAYPERLNLNAFTAIIGAIVDQDWRRIDPDLKSQARVLLRHLKRR